MSLENYFQSLINKVESSEDIHNGGKDENGFYKPTRTLLLRQLRLLKDLHQKPGARAMVKDAWRSVAKELPAEWLVLTDEEKKELRTILE